MVSPCWLLAVVAVLPTAEPKPEDLARRAASRVVPADPAAPPELNDQTYTRWRDLIRPKPKELSWEEVPWHSTFWDAVVEAQRKDMPILVWAMNGHPLACT